MRSDAGGARTEDRMDTIHTLKSGAADPRGTLVARRSGVVEVRAARTLQEIATDRCLVPKLARGARQERFRQHAVPCSHQGIAGDLGVCCKRSDPQAAVWQVFDLP